MYLTYLLFFYVLTYIKKWYMKKEEYEKMTN